MIFFVQFFNFNHFLFFDSVETQMLFTEEPRHKDFIDAYNYESTQQFQHTE